MRKQATLLALAFAFQAQQAGQIKLANNVRATSNNAMGESPFFMPTRSQRRKNKILKIQSCR